MMSEWIVELYEEYNLIGRMELNEKVRIKLFVKENSACALVLFKTYSAEDDGAMGIYDTDLGRVLIKLGLEMDSLLKEEE